MNEDEIQDKVATRRELIITILVYTSCFILLTVVALFMRNLRIDKEKDQQAFYDWYEPYGRIEADYNRKMSALKDSIDEFFMISNTGVEKEKVDILYEDVKIKYNNLQAIAHEYNKGTSVYRDNIRVLKVPTVDEIHNNSLEDILGGWYKYYKHRYAGTGE